MTSKDTVSRTPELKDVESGSDADVTPTVNIDTRKSDVPAPLETGRANQLDDNVDDLRNKAGGGKLEQPINGPKEK